MIGYVPSLASRMYSGTCAVLYRKQSKTGTPRFVKDKLTDMV